MLGPEVRRPTPVGGFLVKPSRSQSGSISAGGVQTSLVLLEDEPFFSIANIAAARLRIRPGQRRLRQTCTRAMPPLGRRPDCGRPDTLEERLVTVIEPGLEATSTT